MKCGEFAKQACKHGRPNDDCVKVRRDELVWLVFMGFPFRGKNEVEDSINLAIHLTSFQVAQLMVCPARSLYTQ
jgi:hypothetical protein